MGKVISLLTTQFDFIDQHIIRTFPIKCLQAKTKNIFHKLRKRLIEKILIKQHVQLTDLNSFIFSAIKEWVLFFYVIIKDKNKNKKRDKTSKV